MYVFGLVYYSKSQFLVLIYIQIYVKFFSTLNEQPQQKDTHKAQLKDTHKAQ